LKQSYGVVQGAGIRSSPRRRVGAFVLDVLFLTPISVALFATVHDALGANLLAVAVFLLYFIVFELSRRCATPGKRIAGIEVRDASGGPPNIVQVVMRLLFFLPPMFPMALPFTFLRARKGKSWISDLATRTEVTLSRASEQRVQQPL
jgi:uncharacterized RDD family membrane protein YckC